MRSGMVQYHESLDALMEPIDTIIQHPENYNNGAVEEIQASIERVGMYRPIIVARDTREIVAGNHTWMACKSMGATQIPVVWFDGEITEQMIALVGDNTIARLARPDDSQLLSILNDLEAQGELMGTGFEEPDLERMRRSVEQPLDTDKINAEIEKNAWPTLFISVPPATHAAFYDLASEVEGGDRERLESIMKLAGWRP